LPFFWFSFQKNLDSKKALPLNFFFSVGLFDSVSNAKKETVFEDEKKAGKEGCFEKKILFNCSN
jgi:hypothetical protein